MKTAEERAQKVPGPASARVINGVRICRLILAAAALALIAYAVSASEYFFALLAVGSLAAIFVKVRNVRSILAAIAFVEAMYFVADFFSPATDSNGRIALFAVCAAVIGVAILRLRYWESEHGTDLHPAWRLGAGTVGLILIISAALMSFAPVSSSQLSGSTSNAQCGSVLIKRTLPAGWTNTSVPVVANQCHDARHERLAFALLQFEVGLGGIWVGRSALKQQSRRVLIYAVVIAFLAAFVGAGWERAAVANANEHDALLAPWFKQFDQQFVDLSAANATLRDGVKNKDQAEIASACQTMLNLDRELQPSIAGFPTIYQSERDMWSRFLSQHSADATKCLESTSKSGTATTGWFADSSATLSKLHNTLSYW